MPRIITLIIFFFIFQTLLTGQQNAYHCKAALKRNLVLENHPHLKIEQESKKARWLKWINEEYPTVLLQHNTLHTLPVVIHVLWRNNDQNISDEQIQSQIDVLNEDFRKLNDNVSSLPAAFNDFAADVEFEFCLASIDPNGNATSGITRRQVNISEIGETENYYSTANGGQDAWDNNKYINIWVAELSSDLFGFASFPGQAFPPESDGLVIQSSIFW